jgi:sugar (pentulose or hexulose) kinase
VIQEYVAAIDQGTTSSRCIAVGISNQRETTLVWERDSGRPAHPAIVWQDTRTETQLRRFDKVFRCGGLPGAHRAAARALLRRLETGLAAGKCAGAARAGRARQSAADGGVQRTLDWA